jgi:hypothetical protein
VSARRETWTTKGSTRVAAGSYPYLEDILQTISRAGVKGKRNS